MRTKEKSPVDPERSDSSPSVIEAEGDNTHNDAVFGELNDSKGPNYRNVGWIGIIGLMLKAQVGLGVLSIPAVFDVLGLIPGVICILAVGGIVTWSCYMVGVFKLRHREVYGIDDAGFLMFGPLGREVFGVFYCIYYIFIAGSAILSLSIGLNAVSMHGTCTAVFVVIGALIGFMFSSIRTLGKLTWVAWVGITSVLTAVLMVAIAVGIQDRPSEAPQDGPWTSDYKLFKTPSFTSAVTAVSSLVFSFGGAPSFFALIAEMRDPRDYTRSLMICQSLVTAIYISIGCVVYYFCGSYVATPALGSAGVMLKRVAYGLALPGLAITTTVIAHFPAKYMFSVWLGCTFSVNLIAYLIASGIPSFGPLVSLIGALLGALLNLQPMGCMWLYDNWNSGKTERSTKWRVGAAWSVFVIVAGTFLMVAGTYGSVVAIIDAYKGLDAGAWSCADNSNSVSS
ncbi:putative amino acid transporter [Sarocladium strictum]